MKRGLVVLLLAACNGGQGVDIEVHSEENAFDTLQLWVAYDSLGMDKADSITGPNVGAPSGIVYTLGPETEKLSTIKVVNGVGQIHLEVPPGKEKPIAIAILGIKDNGVVGVKELTGIEIPSNDQAKWVVTLHDAGTTVETNTTADPGTNPHYNAFTWPRDTSSTLSDTTGYAGCLVYQKWEDTMMWRTDYFVPEDDPDCDGDPPDCSPYVYQAPVGTARCLGHPSQAQAVCALGAPVCRDELSTVACTPTTMPLTCVGSDLCNLCPSGDTSLDVGMCFKAAVLAGMSPSTNTTFPIERCPMYTIGDGPCPTSNATPAGWEVTFYVPGGLCVPGGPNGEYAVLREIDKPFSNGGTTVGLSGGVDLALQASPAMSTGLTACAIKITWTGGGGMPPRTPIVLAVFYANSREELLPVWLDFQHPPAGSTCPIQTSAISCTNEGLWPEISIPGSGDSVFSCGGAP